MPSGGSGIMWVCVTKSGPKLIQVASADSRYPVSAFVMALGGVPSHDENSHLIEHD